MHAADDAFPGEVTPSSVTVAPPTSMTKSVAWATPPYRVWVRSLESAVASGSQTWHDGLVARWWAEFNDDFRPHEIPYFQGRIERGGEPALDVACGTGRLLLPYHRAGLGVDGCDVSADMIASRTCCTTRTFGKKC